MLRDTRHAAVHYVVSIDARQKENPARASTSGVLTDKKRADNAVPSQRREGGCTDACVTAAPVRGIWWAAGFHDRARPQQIVFIAKYTQANVLHVQIDAALPLNRRFHQNTADKHAGRRGVYCPEESGQLKSGIKTGV